MYSMFISSDMSVENRKIKIAEFVRLHESNPKVIASALNISNEVPVLVEADDFPQMSSDVASAVKKYAACMKNEATEISPLLKDETLVSDFVSCLKQPFKEHDKGVAVLRRITSLGTIYYFADHYKIDPDTGIIKFTYVSPVTPDYEPEIVLKAEASSIATQLLSKFAQALAGKIGGFVGSELLKFIFPGSQGIDFKQLLHDFAKIVKDANVDQTVAEQDGVINGIINYMNGYYNNRKSSSAPKKELYDFLLAQQSPLNMTIGVLEEPDFKEKGLASFISAAQVDFVIYQELALQDYTVPDPLNSSNVASLKKQIDIYAEFANGVIKQIIDKRVTNRAKMLKPPYVDPFSGMEDPKSYWYYYDNKTKKRYGPWIDYKNSHAEQKCREDYNKYKTQVENSERTQATADCKQWSDMVAQWPLIKNKPLGK
ncbi:MAG: hypothetical protein AB1746_02520 [Candidatus Zixiibacteriota bacterium]